MVDLAANRAHDPSPDLEPEHRRAICKEIGERLRGTLADDAAPLQPQLEGPVERLTESDDGASPTTSAGQDDAASLPLWKRVMRLWRIL
ncbi:hypothetical protein XH79_08415 [Bradyrhizobium sp. CCBAU 45389]|nr:hypothetical protein [Bradyrhizobium sp. CCBAU 45389]